MSKVYDVVCSTGSYIGQDGQEKQRWMNIGAVFKNDQGRVSIKLDAIPVRTNEKGELWLSCFVPKPRKQPAQVQAPRQEPSQQQAGFEDEIPF